MAERIAKISLTSASSGFAMLLVAQVASGAWQLDSFALLPLVVLFFSPTLKLIRIASVPAFLASLWTQHRPSGKLPEATP